MTRERHTTGRPPDHSAFLARLSALTPDSSGTAPMDVEDFPVTAHRELLRLAEAHGWTMVGQAPGHGRRAWLLARHGAETVTRNTEYFIKGPGIEELARHPGAHQAAADAEREFGVNPLSHVAYREAAAQYKKDSQRTNRWAALFSLPLLALIVVIPTTVKPLGDDGATTAVIIGIWIALAVLSITGALGLVRAHRQRTATFAPYKNAYEAVAHSSIAHSGPEQPTVDDER